MSKKVSHFYLRLPISGVVRVEHEGLAFCAIVTFENGDTTGVRSLPAVDRAAIRDHMTAVPVEYWCPTDLTESERRILIDDYNRKRYA